MPTADAQPVRPGFERDGLPADPVLRSWLTNRGSLTRRLRERGGARFELEVIGEGLEPASGQDRALLGSQEDELHVRRVRLAVDGRMLVHACTLAPAATLARHPWLGELGRKPLGEALSDLPGVRRTPFEYAWIESGQAPLSAALRRLDIGPPGLWGRRSLFLVDDAPILVYEFFLPALASLGPA